MQLPEVTINSLRTINQLKGESYVGGKIKINPNYKKHGQEEQTTVLEELERLPDQGQQSQGEGLPTPEQPDIIGPVRIGWAIK